jgi:hypothetical protein
MSGLPTLLLTRVESLLPRTAAAACIHSNPGCTQVCTDGVCHHKYCYLNCQGTDTCGPWIGGTCS